MHRTPEFVNERILKKERIVFIGFAQKKTGKRQLSGIGFAVPDPDFPGISPAK